MITSSRLRLIIAVFASHFAMRILSLFGLGLFLGWLGKILIGIIIALVVDHWLRPKEQRTSFFSSKDEDS